MGMRGTRAVKKYNQDEHAGFIYIYINIDITIPGGIIIFHYTGPPRCKAGTDPGSATRCFWMSCGNVVKMAACRGEVQLL